MMMDVYVEDVLCVKFAGCYINCSNALSSAPFPREMAENEAGRTTRSGKGFARLLDGGDDSLYTEVPKKKKRNAQKLLNSLSNKVPLAIQDIGINLLGEALRSAGGEDDMDRLLVQSSLSIVSTYTIPDAEEFADRVYSLYRDGFCKGMIEQHGTWKIEDKGEFNFKEHRHEYVLVVCNVTYRGSHHEIPVAYVQFGMDNEDTRTCYVHQLYVADAEFCKRIPALTQFEYVRKRGFNGMKLGKVILATVNVVSFIKGCRLFFLYVSPLAKAAIGIYESLEYRDLDTLPGLVQRESVLKRMAEFEKWRLDLQRYGPNMLTRDVVQRDRDKIYFKMYDDGVSTESLWIQMEQLMMVTTKPSSSGKRRAPSDSQPAFNSLQELADLVKAMPSTRSSGAKTSVEDYVTKQMAQLCLCLACNKFVPSIL